MWGFYYHRKLTSSFFMHFCGLDKITHKKMEISLSLEARVNKSCLGSKATVKALLFHGKSIYFAMQAFAMVPINRKIDYLIMVRGIVNYFVYKSK